MRITVIGTGYVGLVTGVCFAELGNNVICTDVDKKKIDKLQKGIATIYEPGLEELLKRNIEAGRLTFSTDNAAAIKQSKVVFSAVGTPMGKSYEADLKYVKQVAKEFAESIDKYTLLVTKSTVPVGTGEHLESIISKTTSVGFDIVSNPEFLREGNAIKDFMVPDRIVVGCKNQKACDLMSELYRPITRTSSPLLLTDIKSSELIKYAANSMLATRISFMNEIAKYCDLVGANVKEVAKGIGLDDRIGPRFLQAGIGYGGSCFPKDVVALVSSGKSENYDFKILSAVDLVNRTQYELVLDKLKKQLGDLKGKKIIVWGLAFKPKTDDVRDAPSAAIIQDLLEDDAVVHAFDPVAMKQFAENYPNLDVNYLKDEYEEINDADALVLVTEWNEFRVLDFEKLYTMNKQLIVDGRNIFDPKELSEKGLIYEGVGNPPTNQ